MRTYLYILTGYLLGSILFANIFMDMFHEKGAIEESKDKNPGTANAFLYGGFWCGLLTLLCDMGKGFLPVFFFAAPRTVKSTSTRAMATHGAAARTKARMFFVMIMLLRF